jgi:hypothetical protein
MLDAIPRATIKGEKDGQIKALTEARALLSDCC